MATKTYIRPWALEHEALTDDLGKESVLRGFNASR
jgi:hypothetical protein